MNEGVRPVLVTIRSLKGGPGKTTAVLNLLQKLGTYGSVVMFDGDNTNPQHQEILDAKPPEQYWCTWPETKNGLEPVICTDLKKIITPASQTAPFRHAEAVGNIGFIFPDPTLTLAQQHATRHAHARKTLDVYTEEQYRLLQTALPVFGRIGESGKYLCVVVDLGAGLDDNVGSLGSVLHRCVKGYDEKHQRAELENLYRGRANQKKLAEALRSNVLLAPIQKLFGNWRPFEHGVHITVTSPAKSDLPQLPKRIDCYPDMGSNNQYFLIVNRMPTVPEESEIPLSGTKQKMVERIAGEQARYAKLVVRKEEEIELSPGLRALLAKEVPPELRQYMHLVIRPSAYTIPQDAKDRAMKHVPTGIFNKNIFFAPVLRDTGFGNIFDANPCVTVSGGKAEQKLYAEVIDAIKNKILSHAMADWGMKGTGC